MAKGNLILGTAQKKLGDVVMYRRNGVQQARVRVRTIQNPKTEGQALQRNYMSPVAKFYAPLAGVLERSWEGLNKAQSHNAFTKANVELARANGWYVNKGAGFTPLPYKVSKGVMNPLFYTDLYLSMDSTPSDIKIATISAQLVALGYQYGDQCTCIACIRNEQSGDIRPMWDRFILSESEQTNIFTKIYPYVQFAPSTNKLDIDAPGDELVGIAFIMSRWDGKKWLRSTQYVVCPDSYMEEFTSMEARTAAIASYQGGAAVVSSDIYLNGGTGSTSEETQTSFDYYDASGASRLGAVQLTEVVSAGSAGNAVLLRGVKVNNGATIVLEVQDAVTGSSTLNKFLDGAGAFSVETNGWGNTLKYTGSGSALHAWLVANGITIA